MPAHPRDEPLHEVMDDVLLQAGSSSATSSEFLVGRISPSSTGVFPPDPRAPTDTDPGLAAPAKAGRWHGQWLVCLRPLTTGHEPHAENDRLGDGRLLDRHAVGDGAHGVPVPEGFDHVPVELLRASEG